MAKKYSENYNKHQIALIRSEIDRIKAEELEIKKEVDGYLSVLNKHIAKCKSILREKGLGSEINSSLYSLSVEVNSKLSLRFKASSGEERVKELLTELEQLELSDKNKNTHKKI
jgi:hypothetical protein